MYGKDVAAPAAARVDQLLVDTTFDVGAHVGVVYLAVPERQVLQIATEVGAPIRLADTWVRMTLAEPSPVAVAFLSRQPVWVAGQDELARRYPRIALTFPYSVAHYAVPLIAGGECWGTLLLLWPGSRANSLSSTERIRVADGAYEMASVMDDAAVEGLVVSPPPEPRVVDSPYPLADGFVALDLHGRVTFLTERAAQLLDRDRSDLEGAEPWTALPWLSDPVYENAFVAVLVSREPTAFFLGTQAGRRVALGLPVPRRDRHQHAHRAWECSP